jgi:predicted nucleic acid-binding protein
VLAEATTLFRRLERAKLITSPDANAARIDLIQLDLDLYSFEPFADRIWELRRNVTSYDAWYVALADALNIPLATLNLSLSKSAGTTCEFLTPKA